MAPSLLVACAKWLPAPIPMRSVVWQAPDAVRAKCLVVFLPGRGDDAQDFEGHGFVADVRRRGAPIDVIAAQATLGYYARGTFADRLADDVIGPARRRGYEQIWLIGVSMGGLGTISYSRKFAEQITGVVALAPYLGEDDVIDEIYAQGGLARWKAPPKTEAVGEDNFQQQIWRWLQAATRGEEPAPKLYLGYGRSDRLARGDALLGAALPAEQKYVIDGGHDWKTWRTLLGMFLEQSPFVRSCQ